VAGAWIRGGANQAAMKEIYEVGDSLFSAMVAVDVIIANCWMAELLYMAGNSERIDAKTGADATAVTNLKNTVEAMEKKMARVSTSTDLMMIFAIGIGVT